MSGLIRSSLQFQGLDSAPFNLAQAVLQYGPFHLCPAQIERHRTFGGAEIVNFMQIKADPDEAALFGQRLLNLGGVFHPFVNLHRQGRPAIHGLPLLLEMEFSAFQGR